MRRTLITLIVVTGLGCEAPAPEPHFEAESAARSAPTRQPEKPRDEIVPTQAAPAPASQVAPQKPLVRRPNAPDPLGGKFALKAALSGLSGKGPLRATLETSEGNLDCTLFEDKAPLTVANFVGLARGLRPFWDAREAAWVKRPLFDGTTFHRVIAGFMIQGGDHLGDGTGDVGYEVPDELHPSLTHDRAGLLCMANKGPNTNGGQFFITDAAAPHLTQMKTYTIFGECAPVDVVHKIANVPKASRMSERPLKPVEIKRVSVRRGG